MFAESGPTHLYDKIIVELRKNGKISIMVLVLFSSQKAQRGGSKEGQNNLCDLCLRAALYGGWRLA